MGTKKWNIIFGLTDREQRFVDWLKANAHGDAKASEEWAKLGSESNKQYRAGASNAYLDVLSYIEHTGLFIK